MSMITIYGDEAGTPPMRQSEGNFVAAVVATRADPLEPSAPDTNRTWHLQWMRKSLAHPGVVYIRPTAQYDRRVREKLTKMDTMARYRKLVTGKHKYVARKGGIVPRNFLWVRCMHIAIGQAVVSALATGEVSSIRIVLDQMTFQPETERFFRDQLDSLAGHLSLEISSLDGHQAGAAKLRERLQFSAATVHLEWNSDRQPPLGLRVADYIARHARRELTDTGRISVLQDAGVMSFDIDVTPTLMSPLDPKACEKWRRDTSLWVPVIGL